MPELKYKGKTVVVANEETTDLVWVNDIPAEKLFISEPNRLGKRFAFNIEEIEHYVQRNNSLVNFYNTPRNAFSSSEISELIHRSPFLKDYIDDYVKKSDIYAPLISPETLRQMELLVKRCSYFVEDTRFINEVQSNYEEDELNTLLQNDIVIHDLARGMAFQTFKCFYNNLSSQEQQAIDHFPGVAPKLQQFMLGTSLKNIFNLQGDACLGGSAGVCREIITQIKFLGIAKEAVRQAAQLKEKTVDEEEEVVDENFAVTNRNYL